MRYVFMAFGDILVACKIALIMLANLCLATLDGCWQQSVTFLLLSDQLCRSAHVSESTRFVILCLADLTECPQVPIVTDHRVASFSFLKLSSLPLCICAVFLLMYFKKRILFLFVFACTQCKCIVCV